MLTDLLLKSRSYRRFDESVKMSEATLRELIDVPSSRIFAKELG